MLGLLRLPPLLVVIIILALAGFLVYRLVEAGKVQPIPVIILGVLAVALVRILFSIWHKARIRAKDE